ncbi:MAG: hypothetical protein AAFY47_12285 [Pseudomonadota bacterium]
MTALTTACAALLANLSSLPSWPDGLGLENLRRRRVNALSVDVACWRESVRQADEYLGDDGMESPRTYLHEATIRIELSVTGSEAGARAVIDNCLSEAGSTIDGNLQLGALVNDVRAAGVEFDFADSSEAGHGFHSATLTILIDYHSTNPFI